jgi:hypothetical protein
VRVAAATMAVAAAVTLFLGVALGRSDDGDLGRLERVVEAMEKVAVRDVALAALNDSCGRCGPTPRSRSASSGTSRGWRPSG